jgi:hypothetical protein
MAVNQVIEACEGGLRAMIRALILPNEFMETQISAGYGRGVRKTKSRHKGRAEREYFSKSQ